MTPAAQRKALERQRDALGLAVLPRNVEVPAADLAAILRDLAARRERYIQECRSGTHGQPLQERWTAQA